MRDDIKESDWKQFREIHPLALERFTLRCLDEIQYFLTDKSKPAAERFWEIEEVTRERSKDVRMFFDDFRRSTAVMQLAAMRYRKLVTDEEMARFSAETRERAERMLATGR